MGASSGIGAELARELTRRGCRVALVARRETELAALATELRGDKPEPLALTYVHDVRDWQAVPALWEQICRDLGGLDLIIYNSGIMPRIEEDQYDTAQDENAIGVNLTGAVAWLNLAAQRFGQLGSGTICGIGSVAGDRGRRAQPVYGACKAALETYLEALRNRLGVKGVQVVTIKPGPVDTAMTAHMTSRPLLISPTEAARQILHACETGASVRYVPGTWRIIMAVIRALPSPIMQRLGI